MANHGDPHRRDDAIRSLQTDLAFRVEVEGHSVLFDLNGGLLLNVYRYGL